jgi:tRNA-dihydrouridine synthase
VFKECSKAREYTPSPDERKRIMLDFIELHSKQKRNPFSELKQHMMWLTAKLKGASRLRKEFMHTENIDQVKKVINAYFTQII